MKEVKILDGIHEIDFKNVIKRVIKRKLFKDWCFHLFITTEGLCPWVDRIQN